MANSETESRRHLSSETSNLLVGLLISFPVAFESGKHISEGNFFKGGLIGGAAAAIAMGITIAANRLRIDLNK